jgi:hypothetical protein
VVGLVRFLGLSHSFLLFCQGRKYAMVHLVQPNEFVGLLQPILFFLKVKVPVPRGKTRLRLEPHYFLGHAVETIHRILAVELVCLPAQVALLAFYQPLHLDFIFLLDGHFGEHVWVFLLLSNCFLSLITFELSE